MTQLQLNDGLTSLATNLGKRQDQLQYRAKLHLTEDTLQLNALCRQSDSA
ncbi:hypothetical protein ACFGYK_04440 [Pasteurella multocida]